MKSLFRCHFFINAANKVVAEHLMWRGEVYLSRKLPPTIFAPHMVLSLLLGLS